MELYILFSYLFVTKYLQLKYLQWSTSDVAFDFYKNSFTQHYKTIQVYNVTFMLSSNIIP